MSAARFLALGVAALALGCAPGVARQKAEQAAECLSGPAVKRCLADWACAGPDKPCGESLAKYTLSCLELCKPPGPPCAVGDPTWYGGECDGGQ